jgi:hypothetical protein
VFLLFNLVLKPAFIPALHIKDFFSTKHLNGTHCELVDIEKAIAAEKEKHNGFSKELGL